MTRFAQLNLIAAIAFLFVGVLFFLGHHTVAFLGFFFLLGIYQFIVVMGVIRLDWQLFVSAQWRGRCPEERPCLALTFDDGPSAITTPHVLDVLKKYDVKATFFIVGEKLRLHPEIVQRAHREGHLIANHTLTHDPFLNLASYRRYREEVEETQKLIKEFLGVDNHYFRPPVGLSNPRMAKVVDELGLMVVGWSIRSLDTRGGSPEKIVERILKHLHSGAIILLHDRLDDAPQILEKLLEKLFADGWQILPLEILLAKHFSSSHGEDEIH